MRSVCVTCIIEFVDLSVENVLTRIHIHAQCVNCSADISYLPALQSMPIDWFIFLGLTYCGDRNIIFRQQGTCVYVCLLKNK
jgi:hypothetical protein